MPPTPRQDQGLPSAPDKAPDQGPEKAQEPVARTQSAAKVLYKGTSNVREISLKDLAQVGIEAKDREGAKDLRWSAQNLFMVPMSDLAFLSEEEFNRVIKADKDFAVVDADKALPRNHPENNRFKQPDAVTEGLPDAGGGGSTDGPTTTVGGATTPTT